MGAEMPPMDNFGGMPPMDDNVPPAPNGDEMGGEDFGGENENDNVLDLSEFSVEDAAAIKKYADSFKDKKEDENNESQPEGEMPMESKMSRTSKLVSEVMDSILRDRRDGKKGTKRNERFIENDKITRSNPFVGNR